MITRLRRLFGRGTKVTAAVDTPRRLNILHLGFEDFRKPGSGGGAVRTHEINKRIAREHNITVLTTQYANSRDRIEDGVQYVHIGKAWGYFGGILTYFAALPFAMRKYRADLVIEDFAAPFSSSLSPLWTRTKIIAMVQWLNAKEKSKQYHLPFWIVERWGLRLHKHYIAVSQGLATKIKAEQSQAEVTVIANGVDDIAFSEPLDLPRSYILFLGRIEREQKGLDLLLDAYADIADRTAVDLVCVGDGPDVAWFKRRIHELGLDKRVKLLGRLNGHQKYRAFARAQVVAMPSRFETFGMVAVEAQAVGTPVVVFDIDCLRDVVPHRLGSVVPAFDVSAFGDALLYHLKAYTALGAQTTLNLRQTRRDFARHYQWDALAAQQQQVYERRVAIANVPATAPQPAILGQKLWFAVGLLAIVGLTIGMRLIGLGYLYDIHIDEITYARFAQTIGGNFMPLLYNGDPFFLHPPLYYGLLALWRDVVWHGHDMLAELIALRTFNVALAGLTAVVTACVVARLARRRSLGMLAGLLFAVDPLIIRHTTRGLMEPLTMLLLLLGIWCLLRVLEKSVISTRAILGTGLLFGLAIVTKDLAAVFIVAMLGLMLWRKVGLGRRTWLLLPGMVLPYAIWVTIVTANGYLQPFLAEKLSGLQRFAGLMQTTGFNSDDSPSKLEAISQTLIAYGPSYIIMGLGVMVGATLLLFSKRAGYRRWGCVAAASALLLGYAFAAGAMEEQFLYYLLTPGIITVILAVTELYERMSSRHMQQVIRAVALTCAAGLIIYASILHATALQTPDQGWTKTAQWMTAHVPAGSVISVSDQGEFLLRDNNYTLSRATTLVDMQAQGVEYVVIAKKLSDAGYSLVTAQTARKVLQQGTVVFDYTGRDNGEFMIVQLPQSTIPKE